MTKKVNVAMIGSGNIGADLMMKLLRSEILNPTVMIGVDPESKGLALARENGIKTFDYGIKGLEENPELADIVFDATSAKAHLVHAEILKKLGKKVIDLTPAAVGPYCVPAVSLDEEMINSQDNVNMVTCGGQATVPIIKAISDIVPVEYGEIVASISSKSAGPGTRQNIDEFTETTANALEKIGGAKKAKALIVLNPADPPILMRNTVFAKLAENYEGKENEILDSIFKMVEVVKGYVPGYHLMSEPVIKDGIVKVFVEVEGLGDFLPKYSGNLDIITSAAVRTAEVIATSMVVKENA
ncbi:acetaldehyde dehydrogenase (acetylating) [Bacillus sp. B15-48]|uniref:acetaldehyde dehydrogenase (acetylating) n=1 Tax=Bacillus sp. B15-48 TaxID=1548601 RepID=UPI00193FD9AE|nr:acetaldehyde dehydrogenase (acetylating) [Bacillus sp. B15-48]